MLKKFFIAFLFVFMIACSNQNNSSLDNIEQAIENNQDLKNGTFEVTQTFVSETGNLHQKITGSFINEGEENSSWHTVLYLDSANQSQYTEQLQTDGTIYKKAVLSDENQTWHEVSEDTRTFPHEMEPLMHFDGLDNVDSIEMEEVNGNTNYIVEINDEYSEEIIENNIEALKNNMKLFEEMDMPEEVISSVETQIEEMRKTVFNDIIFTYVMNQEEHIVEVHFEYQVNPPNSGAFTNKGSYFLTNYNLDSAEDLIPSL